MAKLQKFVRILFFWVLILHPAQSRLVFHKKEPLFYCFHCGVLVQKVHWTEIRVKINAKARRR